MEKLKPKKSLGQNFLKDETVIDRIIEAAGLSKNDTVLEIGPGHGALTEKLVKTCKQVIAIELDDRLIELLHTKFVGNENFEVIHGDILKINLPKLIEEKVLSLKSGKVDEATNYKVVANLPYYITSPIIRMLLETKYPPHEMFLMVQKEVAERIVAKPGEMSILAVSVQFYAKPEFLFAVSRGSFDPVPKVDSAILKISVNGNGARNSREEAKRFFRVVRSGFSAKRKTLVNNLSSGLQMEKKMVESILVSIGFSGKTRAQELGLEDWKRLAGKLYEILSDVLQ